MSEEIPSDWAYKPRSALGDVTNQIVKRGVSTIYKKDEGIRIAKKECIRVDENHNKQTEECILRPQSCSEINSLKENIISSVSDIECEIKEPCQPSVRQNATSTSATVKAGDVVRYVYESTQLITTIPSDQRADSAVIPQIELSRMAGNNLGMDDGNGASFDKLDSIKDEYLDCSQESMCGLKGDGFSSACMDMIKTCTCSFCMKASYIWSDLHCQDINGRIDAVKKSQKRASILVDRNSMNGARNFGKFSNLETESNLTGQWKSLFLQMEDVFVREGTQLETSLCTLKNLVDNSEKN